MPLCGFNAKMIDGIAIFAEGLFEATLARSKEEKLTVEQAFKKEVQEISLFLEALENKHQELKRTNDPAQTMSKAVEWIAENDRTG